MWELVVGALYIFSLILCMSSVGQEQKSRSFRLLESFNLNLAFFPTVPKEVGRKCVVTSTLVFKAHPTPIPHTLRFTILLLRFQLTEASYI